MCVVTTARAMQGRPTDDLTKRLPGARVFLARLRTVYGIDAPEQFRRVADELEQLALDADDERDPARLR